MLNSYWGFFSLLPSLLLLPASHQRSFHFIHPYLHIILNIPTLSLMSHVSSPCLCVAQTLLGVKCSWQTPPRLRRGKTWAFALVPPALLRQATHDLYNCINFFLMTRAQIFSQKENDGLRLIKHRIPWTLTHLIKRWTRGFRPGVFHWFALDSRFAELVGTNPRDGKSGNKWGQGKCNRKQLRWFSTGMVGWLHGAEE